MLPPAMACTRASAMHNSLHAIRLSTTGYSFPNIQRNVRRQFKSNFSRANATLCARTTRTTGVHVPFTRPERILNERTFMSTTTTTRYRTLEAEHKFEFYSREADHIFMKVFVGQYYSDCASFKRVPTQHFTDEYHFTLPGLTVRCRDSIWQAKRDLDFDAATDEYWAGHNEAFQIFEIFDTYNAITQAIKDAHIEDVGKEENDETNMDSKKTEPLNRYFFDSEPVEVKTRREQFEIDGVFVEFDFFSFDPKYYSFISDDAAEREDLAGKIRIRRQVTEDRFGYEKQKMQQDLSKFVEKYRGAFGEVDFDTSKVGQLASWCQMQEAEEEHKEEFMSDGGHGNRWD